ncbi:transmembrane protein, putative [Medicago truncatula]|uniref:Transmembrane protein, putative n=1 Tax=Medicago truncatula TaxID=3880 RepID=G7JXV0_MEDTR|nr:transmembrane protein, putative [Medicago truncatula]
MSSNYHHPSCDICIFFFCVLSAFGCIIGLVFVITDSETTTPFSDLPIFQVNRVGALNSLTVNGTQITAEFDISVFAYNHKTYSRAYYKAVSADLFYGGEGLVLNRTSLPSFTTHSKSASVMKMTPSVNISEDFGGVASDVALRRKDGRVEFGLIVSTLFKYKNRFSHSDWTSLKVVCNPLKFAVSRNVYNTTTSHGVLLEGLTCTSTY